MTDKRPPYDPALWFRQFPGDRWIFRWKFEFFDGKLPKVGGWHPATRIEDMACSVNKTNLARAIIEGKHWTTREMRTFADVIGSDFINFEHLAVAIMTNRKLINHVYGMRIQARSCMIIVTEDGRVRHEPRELGSDYIFPEHTRF